MDELILEVDTGLVKDLNAEIYNSVPLTADIKAIIYMKGGLYNYYRELMSNSVVFALRHHSVFPRPGFRTKARAGLNSTEPVTEINKSNYNPALERRLSYKLIPSSKNPKVSNWLNIHYMLENKEWEAAYRADVHRVETKHKLSIKEDTEFRKEEDFNPIETNYKRLRQIMLFKKFDAIYTDRAGSDTKEHKRLKKLIDKDDKRRAEIRKVLPIVQKNLAETHEEKTFLKMMKGPYY
jgi:hypothetical protein